jgi:hypothetical protein
MSKEELKKESVLSFLQATTNTFWNIENAIAQNESAHEKLTKAREDASVMIRSMRQAFPDHCQSINMIQCDTGPGPLEVEE